MKKILIAAALIVVLSLGAWCENFTVTYMSGDAFLLSGGQEEYLDIGSSVDSNARIFIEDDTILELEGAGQTLTIAGPGTYEVAAILGRTQKRQKSPITSLLGNRINKLVSNNGIAKPSSVMGVRGAEAGEEELTWLSGESEVYISSGRESLQKGDYTAAETSFSEGLNTAREFGEQESEMELQFLLSYTQFLNGEPGQALSTLKAIAPDPYAPWYPEYRLHHAQLLLNAGVPGKAAALLRSNDTVSPLQEEGRLLLGIALYEEGGPYQQEGTKILRDLAAGNSRTAGIARNYLDQQD